MTEYLDRLIEISSDSLYDGDPAGSIADFGLSALLHRKNGFFAFESALLVRPSHTVGNVKGAIEWNSKASWKGEYLIDIQDHFFFAENILGEPFSISKNGVFFLDPETAEFSEFAEDIEEWALKVLAEPELHAGYGLAHAWQSKHGALFEGERLGPKVPFVLGGEFEIENLARRSDIELMEFRVQLANQIHSLPDGAEIQIEITD